MEQVDKKSEVLADLSAIKPNQENTGEPVATLPREVDSLDDFEHLGHDVSPLKETSPPVSMSHESSATPRADAPINTGALTGHAFDAENTDTSNDNLSSSIITSFPHLNEKESKFDVDLANKLKPVENLVGESPTAVKNIVDTPQISTSPNLLDMDSTTNLLNMDNDILNPTIENVNVNKKESANSALSDLTSLSSSVAQNVDDFFSSSGNIISKDPLDSFLGGAKTATQNFMEMERDQMIVEPSKIASSFNDLADKFTDSEPEVEDFKQTISDRIIDDILRADSPTADTPPLDTFKDVEDDKPISNFDAFVQREPTPEPIKPEPFKVEPSFSAQAPFAKVITPSPSAPPEDVPVREPSPAPKKETIVEEPKSVPKPTPEVCKIKPKPEVGVIEAEEMFCKMGLDTWFNPERLHPTVEALVYWRDTKKSGAVFGGVLIVLLSLTVFSLISVLAYLSLLALTGTITFRIYKNVLQAVQKTSDGHPFKDLLELDLMLPQDKVAQVSELVVAHVNAGLCELRRLFLVEDLIDSIKFGVLLWCLTYVGAWFNGMTLIIIGFVALFTLPKVYETNKTQIDANLDIVRTKLAEITSKVKAAVPIGKKPEEKKEQ